MPVMRHFTHQNSVKNYNRFSEINSRSHRNYRFCFLDQCLPLFQLFAHTYKNNFIHHVLSTIGMPKRPRESVESFVFARFNEDQRPGNTTEQHFELFYPDDRFSVYSRKVINGQP